MATPALLCGAWSLTGEPLAALLPEARRRAAVGGRVVEAFSSGRLWIAAAPGCMARKEGRLAAWDGFLSLGPGGPWALCDPPRNARHAPVGHYAAVSAELDRGELFLVRDPTGGERLYFAREGPLLLFAASLKTLLALRSRAAVLDSEYAFERGVAELVCFGAGTLIAGVSEVLPGHRLAATDRLHAQKWLWEGLLEPLEGDVRSLSWRLRGVLKDAVARCIGKDGRAAVALSGGVDSASVAALAVKLVGPDRVSAFTCEYQDPDHPSEVAAAADTCRRLGIRDHRMVPISFDDFMAAAPEAVWLAEDPGHWKRSYPLTLARAAAAAGFDKFLTGFGIGSHMGWIDESARAVLRMPSTLRAPALRHWPRPKGRAAAVMAGLHPGLEAPMHRLLYPTLAVLRGRGLLKDLRPFFPSPLGERVEEAADSKRVRGEIDALRGKSLGRDLQHLAFVHMNSCADVARCERPSREIGAVWLGPAHFPPVLPYCYMPLQPGHWPWGPRRRMRPGKLLLLDAMRDILPAELVGRRKNWAQTIGSRRWRDLVLERMDAAAGPSWDALREVFGPAFDAAKSHAPEGMIPLAFWHRLFIAGRFERPPSWRELA